MFRKKKVCKDKKSVYVIMPFTSSPSRNQSQLDGFFKNILKKPIEAIHVEDCEFEVSRSSNEFNITESILSSIFECDYLIADLSGEQANPNVMYELGVRLSLSDKPTILIRENHSKNKNIFDISHMHTHGYDPLDYETLIDYISTKLINYEKRKECYRSPVLDALSMERPYFYRASELQARRKIDILHQAVYGNIFMVIEKSLHSIYKKDPEEFEAAKSKIFSERGLQNQICNYIVVLNELSEEWLCFEGSALSRLGLHNNALSLFVQEFYLHQLIDSRTERKVNACLAEYYQTFHSGMFFDDFKSKMAIQHFITKSFYVLCITNHVGYYLNAQNMEARAEAIKNTEFHCEEYFRLLGALDEFINNFLDESPFDHARKT